MVLQILRYLWYLKYWHIHASSNTDKWYLKDWNIYDFVNMEISMVPQILRYLWYLKDCDFYGTFKIEISMVHSLEYLLENPHQLTRNHLRLWTPLFITYTRVCIDNPFLTTLLRVRVKQRICSPFPWTPFPLNFH